MNALSIALFLVVVAGAFIWLGYQFAVDQLHHDQEQVDQQKAALQAEWQQLDATRRVRSVFLAARRAMQAEATRPSWPPDDHDQEAGR
jgi:cell division protein FtsL